MGLTGAQRGEEQSIITTSSPKAIVFVLEQVKSLLLRSVHFLFILFIYLAEPSCHDEMINNHYVYIIMCTDKEIATSKNSKAGLLIRYFHRSLFKLLLLMMNFQTLSCNKYIYTYINSYLSL